MTRNLDVDGSELGKLKLFVSYSLLGPASDDRMSIVIIWLTECAYESLGWSTTIEPALQCCMQPILRQSWTIAGPPNEAMRDEPA